MQLTIIQYTQLAFALVDIYIFFSFRKLYCVYGNSTNLEDGHFSSTCDLPLGLMR
jgi:hypothetical protein